MSTKARRYQKQGIRQMEQRFNGRVLLADEMGLGKSFQSLKVLQRNKRFMMPAVVICPAPLKWNWSDEASKHIGVNAEILEGTRPSVRHWRRPSLLIINYEILGYWMDYLLDLDPQLIILDEVQRIKSRTAKCTKLCQKLCRYAPHILALSGTPLTNEPSELYTTLNILWPETFRSFYSFARRYTNAQMMPWGWQYKGAKNLPELHSKLKEIGMIRRKKTDVLKELPDKQISVIPQQLKPMKLKEYQKAEKDFLTWLSEISPRLARKAAKAERVVRVGYLRRLAAQLKMEDVYKWIDSYLVDSEEKLIVFGIHKAILKPLFAKYKAKSVLIDGDITGRKRHMAVLEFRKKASKRICFCNIKAGGVGLNMPEASDVLIIELPWTPAEVDQAISRAHRMGQTRKVHARFLVAKDTIEEKLCKILQTKQDVSDAVLDGGSDDLTRLAIFDQLEQELSRGLPRNTSRRKS